MAWNERGDWYSGPPMKNRMKSRAKVVLTRVRYFFDVPIGPMAMAVWYFLSIKLVI